MLDQPCIEIVSSQVRVTSSRLDLEDTLLNVQQRHIDGSSKIENESVHLAGGHVLPYGMAAAVGSLATPFQYEGCESRRRVEVWLDKAMHEPIVNEHHPEV